MPSFRKELLAARIVPAAPYLLLKFFGILLLVLGLWPATSQAQNLPEQQCTGAIPVCQSIYTQPNSYSGFGVSQELNSTNQGCLLSAEKNDVWYVINITTSGNLAFAINPNNNSDDYDFAVWNVTGVGCQAIYNGLAPVRCNYSGASGNTGLSNTNTGAQWSTVLPVTAGQTYILNISNYSSTQYGYSLNFSSSTATIFDNQPPRFSTATVPCNADSINVVMTEPVKCSSLAANGSDFFLAPAVPGISILSSAAAACASGGTSTINFRLKLSGILPNGTYRLKSKLGTDNNTLLDNCNNTQPLNDSVTFTVNNADTPVFALLSPATCSKKAIFTITPTPAGTYTVVFRSGSTVVRTLTSVTGTTTDSLAPGTYTATATNASGCAKVVSFTLVAPPTLTLTASATPTCTGGNVGTATVTATGGTGPYTYSWNTTPAQTTPTATGLTAGTYTVTVTDNQGCSAQASTLVTEPSGMVLQTSIVRESCAGTSSGEVRVIVSGGSAPYSYSWNTTPVQTTANAMALPPGTYQVQVTDAQGCQKTATATVTALPVATVSLGPGQSICLGDSLRLVASGNATSWEWTATAGTLSCTNCAAPMVRPTETTGYRVVVRNAAGCEASDSLWVQVTGRVPVQVGPERVICGGDTAMLFASGGVAYEWQPAQSLSGATTATPVARPEATTYRVVITENQCFKDTLTQKVVVTPRPVVKLPADFKGMSGSEVPLNSTVTNATSLLWTPASGLSCADCPNPVVTLSGTITYVVTATGAGNCTASDTLNISVSCDGSLYYVANTFTPNGDGLDDWFYPQGSNVSVIRRMAIFNRWGEQVFEARNLRANDPYAGWNGTYKGENLPPDVFGYIIEAFCTDGTPVYLKGDINLIR